MSMELSVDGALSVAEEKSAGYNVPMSSIVNGTRRPRTSEDFYLFCTYVLQYENYESAVTEQNSRSAARGSAHSPPLDSSGSSVNSDSTVPDEQREVNADPQTPSGPSRVSNDDGRHSPDDDEHDHERDDDDHDSFDLVTCFCGKPFAGRPMIECSICLTWIHLSCARIKKTNIPDVFHCTLCKSGGSSGRRSRPLASTELPSPTMVDRHRDRSVSPTGHSNNTDKAVKRPKRTSPSVFQDV